MIPVKYIFFNILNDPPYSFFKEPDYVKNGSLKNRVSIKEKHHHSLAVKVIYFKDLKTKKLYSLVTKTCTDLVLFLLNTHYSYNKYGRID